MPWLWLALAIVLEIIGTSLLKLSNGFERVLPFVAMLVCYGLSFSAFTLAIRRIDLGVAYAIWAGVGTAAIATVGIVVYREPVTALKLAAIGLIATGVVLLNVTGEAH